MARAIFSGTYGHNLQLEITSGGSRQDVAGNFSMVNVQVRMIANGYAAVYETGGRSLSVNAGGTVRNISINPYITQGQTKLIFEEEFKIPHNSDGSKSISISARLDINAGGYDWAAVSQNVGLPTIARKSTGSDATGVIDSPITLSINRKHNGFKHAIWATYGTYDKKIADNVDTSYTWTPETSMCEITPDATAGIGTLTYITYSGNTEIGRDIRTLRLFVPDSAKPTLADVTLAESNAVVSAVGLPAGNYIQILSDIAVNFGQTKGVYGSTIREYHAEIVGKNQRTTTNGGKLGLMNYTGNATVRAWVVDSRGRASAHIDKQITVLGYTAPILSFDVTRSGATQGTLTITRRAKIAPLTVAGVQKNKMTLTFRVAPNGTTNYKSDTGPASGSWTTLSELINSQANLIGDYAANKSWTVVGVLEDRFTRSEFSVTVATEKVVMSYDKDGRVGIGKVAERGKAGSVDAAGDYYGEHLYIKDITMNGKMLRDIFYPIGTIYQSVSPANPSNFIGGSWVRFGNGRVLVGVNESDADFNTVHKTGGSKSHKHEKGDMVALIGSGNSAADTIGFLHDNAHTGVGSPKYVVKGSNRGDLTNKPLSHNTAIAGSTSDSSSLQPYVTVYMWRRVS